MHKQLGITLIEMMIVVVILGILSSIAYPSYQSYVGRSYRAEAHSQLQQIANLQEQYYLDQRRFSMNLENLGLVTSSANGDAIETDSGRYTIAVTSAAGYTLTATAQGAQSTLDSDCPTLVLTMTGSKTPPACW
ncbi:type IV pilin protein [Ferrimonas lipolytica]|uniref:Type IV pilin protein n=1 Tax=Ferrimonas lipolytica TaxID=2724191 RepID=A0A6H1UBC1_9GAMM|nr:type IV pilin protein [Ferrimonas lipolytica]QIZ75506.1 type IV pilin protein [Ferrimonas lipolytica]